MRKTLLFIFLSILSLSSVAQTGAENTIPVFFEKVYLHTDRDVYGQGEDIWFKAYVVNAQDNTPINYSHNLYVELIGPGAKLIRRETIRLEGGLGNGDFKLSDTISPGTYRLRAYTNWMRNFGDNFVFEKSIHIVTDVMNLDITDVKAPAAKNKTAKAVLLPKVNSDTLPQVRFFPEGGSMVDKLSSVIAVKAEDSNGRGIPAIGKVLDNTGEVVAAFSCDSLGFGLFTLLPDAAQHYQALVNIRHTDLRFVLPQVLAAGFNLHVQVKQPAVMIAIRGDQASWNKFKGRSVYLTIEHGGKTYASKALQLADQELLINMADNLLPDGICCVTVADDNNQPLCERLFYIHHPSSDHLLSLSIGKTIYQPKEQAIIHIKLSQPGFAHLSLAAVNALNVPIETENIVSYLELQSEVRGKIEHAARYFDTTNVNRFKQLDLLLLTQGWRNFVWKRIADTSLTFNRQVEQAINITGRVRAVSSDKPLKDIQVMLHASQAEGNKFFEAITDSTGKFIIYGPVFYGYQYLDFSSRNFDDKNKGKSDSGGQILVDSLNQDILPVNAEDHFVNDNQPSAAETMTSLKIPKNQQLQEVRIRANTGKFAHQIHTITLADQKNYLNLRQYLLSTIDGAQIKVSVAKNGKVTSFLAAGGGTPVIVLIYADGTNIDSLYTITRPKLNLVYADGSAIGLNNIMGQSILDMPMNQFLEVMFQKRISLHGVQWTVWIKIRPGAFNTKDYFDNTTANMVGYYRARVFYQPKFGAIDDTPDPRINTIHWLPNITTDANGQATVSFHNTAKTGNIRLIVEGVTNIGDVVTALANYKVE